MSDLNDDPDVDLLRTRKVRVVLLGEMSERAPLDPGQYDIKVKSRVDPWFDMYPESVTIEEVAP